MHLNWRFQRVIVGQMFLFILFLWYYSHNSFLRPAVDKGTECFLALVLIIAMAVNYWVLYPLSRNYRNNLLYVLLSVMEVIALATLEYFLTIEVKTLMIPKQLLETNGDYIKRIFFLNLVFRDSGLIAFMGLLAYATDLKIRLFEKDKRLFKLKKQLIVQSSNNSSLSYLLDTDRISYIQQRQNYNIITTTDGYLYERRGSLKDIQELLGKNYFIQISKNTIVRLSSIKNCTDNKVEIRTSNHEKPVLLPIGTAYASSATPIIELVLHDSIQTQEEAQVIENNPVSPLPDIPSKELSIYNYIFEHPGCKIIDIMKGTNFPKSTSTRLLKQLQNKNLIQYVGNNRTGGYRVVEKKDDSLESVETR